MEDSDNAEEKKSGRPRKPQRKAESFTTPVTDMRLLSIEDLQDLTRLSAKTIRQMISDRHFPEPILIPPDSKRPEHRWRLKDFNDWASRQRTTADRISA